MGERRKRLQETARMLRTRLSDLERSAVTELNRPMHEVAVKAVRTSLTEVGHELTRLAVY